MSREIKFRAWDRTHRVMHYQAEQKLSVWLSVVEGLSQTMSEDEDEQLEDRVELLQFTGLKDKNGTEIYEGDILDCKAEAIYPEESALKKVFFGHEFGFVANSENYTVRFEDGSIHTGQNISGLPLNWGGYESLEVIGNIYENPELLNYTGGLPLNWGGYESLEVIGNIYRELLGKEAA